MPIDMSLHGAGGARNVQGRHVEFEYDLRRVRYILAAAEHSSFRRAAEALSTRPSSVSRSVRAMEDQLGVSLFDRGVFGIRLTQAGIRFVTEIQPALNQIRRAMTTAKAAGIGQIGVVRVGGGNAISGKFLYGLFRHFKAKYPEVHLEITNGLRSDLLQGIHAKELDVALLAGTERAVDCDYLELWRERLCVALPRSHRLCKKKSLDWPDISNERVLLSHDEAGQDLRSHILSKCIAHGFSATIEFRQVFPETLMQIIGLGDGVSVVTDAWAHSRYADVRFVPIAKANDAMPFNAVWSPSTDNPALRRFLSMARGFVSKGR